MNDNHKLSSVRALIFDLDGTLIDSKLDLALAVNAVLGHMGLAPLEHEEIFGYVGQGAPMLMRRSLGSAATDENVERALKYFLAYYREHMLDNTVTYPGVREARCAICANACPRDIRVHYLERLSRLWPTLPSVDH